MKKIISLLAGSAALCLTSNVHADLWGVKSVYAKTDSFTFSAPTPISVAADDFRGPLSSGTALLTFNYLESGVRAGKWSFAYIQRRDYVFDANRPTVELYHRLQNRTNSVQGEQFNLDLDIWHVRLTGARFGYQLFDGKAFKLELGLSALLGRDILDGSLTGTATARGGRDYDFAFGVNYNFTNDLLFKRGASHTSGRGYSFDLNLSWNFLKHGHFTLDVKDLLAEIYWKQTPFTRASVANSIEENNANDFQPVLVGREGKESHRQRFDPRATARVAWAFGNYDVFTQVQTLVTNNFVSVGGGRKLGEHGRVEMKLYPAQQALGVDLRWRQFRFGITTDDADISNAHLLSLQLGVGWDF